MFHIKYSIRGMGRVKNRNYTSLPNAAARTSVSSKALRRHVESPPVANIHRHVSSTTALLVFHSAQPGQRELVRDIEDSAIATQSAWESNKSSVSVMSSARRECRSASSCLGTSSTPVIQFSPSNWHEKLREARNVRSTWVRLTSFRNRLSIMVLAFIERGLGVCLSKKTRGNIVTIYKRDETS